VRTKLSGAKTETPEYELNLGLYAQRVQMRGDNGSLRHGSARTMPRLKAAEADGGTL